LRSSVADWVVKYQFKKFPDAPNWISISFQVPQIEGYLTRKGEAVANERVCRESTSGHRVTKREAAMIEFTDGGAKLTRVRKSKQAGRCGRGWQVILSVALTLCCGGCARRARIYLR